MGDKPMRFFNVTPLSEKGENMLTGSDSFFIGDCDIKAHQLVMTASRCC
jgi:hypothetical protein